MRTLLAALLVLPFLLGGSARIGAPADPGESGRETLSRSARPFAQAAFGDHMTAAASTLPTALRDTGPADSWRTPERTYRASAHPLGSRSCASVARSRIAILQRARLEFGCALARARTNFPATFGNPPPVSHT